MYCLASQTLKQCAESLQYTCHLIQCLSLRSGCSDSEVFRIKDSSAAVEGGGVGTSGHPEGTRAVCACAGSEATWRDVVAEGAAPVMTVFTSEALLVDQESVWSQIAALFGSVVLRPRPGVQGDGE